MKRVVRQAAGASTLVFLLTPLHSCGSDGSEPELRKEPELNLTEEDAWKTGFNQSPKLLEIRDRSATFEFSSETNAILFGTFETGKHTPLTPTDILEKGKVFETAETVRQVGVLRGKVSRISFYSLPENQPIRFYFFLKDIYRKDTSMVKFVDLTIENKSVISKISGTLPKAYQGRPWTQKLKIENDCLYYFLDAPKWLRLTEGVLSGTPDSSAKLGTFDVKIIGDESRGCVTDKTFSLEVVGDPLYKESWHMENKGQKAYAWFGALPGFDLNLTEVYRLGLTGRGVHVRVADTGMQIDHPDLVENIDPELNTNIEAKNPQGCAVCDPKNTTPFIEEGSVGDQGTAVAGIIAAKGWNGIGTRGIAPNATLSAINITSIRMKPEYITVEEQLNGEFDILNQSWSKPELQKEDFTGLPVGYFDLQKIKVLAGREKKGSIIVKAAGDDHLELADANLDPFNNMPWQIVVGAISSSGLRTADSNTGSSLWIVAPGGEAGFQSDYMLLRDRDYPRYMFQPAIVSTDLFNAKSPCSVGYSKKASFFLERNNEAKPSEHMLGETTGFNLGWSKDNRSCAYAATVHGTFAAAPMVSGVSALLLERNPNLGWRDVKHILATTARKIDLNFSERYTTLGKQRVVRTLPWVRNAAGYLYHNWYGFGALDASEAVVMADPKTYTNLPALYDSEWLPVFGGGGSITSQKPRGLEKSFTTKITKTVETVAVKIDVSTTRLSQISAELISPSGTRSILLFLNNGSFAKDARELILLSNAFYGEPMAGKWSLQMLSNITDEEGSASVNSWSIRFTGH